MGVLACDRTKCPHIMCDRLMTVGDDQYYVCSECWDELQIAKAQWPKPKSRAELHTSLRDFFKTPPGTYSGPEEIDVDAELKRATRTLWEDD